MDSYPFDTRMLTEGHMTQENITISISRRAWRLWLSLLIFTFILTLSFAIFSLILSERTHVFKRSIRGNAAEIAHAVDALSLTQHDFEASVHQTLAANQQAIAALSQQQSNVSQAQTLNEATYLIRLAYLENQYMRNPTTAQQLLVQARDRLDTISTPYANTLKIRVIRDITTLSTINKPETDLYLSRLDEIRQAVRALPTLPHPPTITPQTNTITPTPKVSWHQWLQKAGHKLDSLIVVQRINGHESAWLAPGALAVLKLGIQSQLWQAEWALVYPDPSRFATCMEQIAQELTTYAHLTPEAQPLAQQIQQYRSQWSFTEPNPLSAWQWVTSAASTALLPPAPTAPMIPAIPPAKNPSQHIPPTSAPAVTHEVI